ncbi:MAG TPA: amidohydrolase family protein, partial [Candidatus Methylacidiphilales bacterium]
APLLARAMKEAARLGLPVHIHPEAGVSELPVWRDGNGGSPSGYRAFLESRPARAEEEAVRIALDLAGETGCALLLGPLTLPASLARVEAARQQHGVRAATAAAAHHLLFSEEDGAAAARSPLGERIVRARPLPPLRPEAERAALFEAARAHRIDLLLSGHAEGHGMRTAQHAFPALLGRPDLAPETGPSPERARLARHCGAEAAAFLGIAGRKGSIAVGKDADLCFLDLEEAVRAEAASLLYGERESLYANQVVGGRVVRVLQRGRTLFANGRMAKVVKGGEVCFIPREGNPG